MTLNTVKKLFTILACILMILLTLHLVRAWEFEYNYADYYREATIATKQLVYSSEEFKNVTKTNITDYKIKKYVTAYVDEIGITSGNMIVEVENTRFSRAYRFNLKNETFLYYNSTPIDYSQFNKELPIKVLVEMDQNMYNRWLEWLGR